MSINSHLSAAVPDEPQFAHLLDEDEDELLDEEDLQDFTFYSIEQLVPKFILQYQELICYALPLIGLVVWMGLVSGYIPSMLYRKGERWPKFYVYLQILLLVMTAWNMGPMGTSSEPRELADMLEVVSIFQSTTLEQLFLYEYRLEYWYEVLKELAGYVLLAFSVRYLLQPWEKEIGNKNNKTKEPSMAWILLRNFGLFLLLDGVSVYYALAASPWCSKLNNQVYVFSDWSPWEIHQRFATAWKIFHRQDLWMVRISHALLYPTILLILSRRRLSDFLVWYLFFEVDFFHMLADMIHYAEDPDLAYERQSFMETKDGCYVDNYLLGELYAYPLNIVYLTTSMGNSELSPAGA